MASLHDNNKPPRRVNMNDPDTDSTGTTDPHDILAGVDKLPCANKIAFTNRQQAQAAAAADAYYHGGRLHAYRCQHCDAWHLSSQPAD